MPQPPHAIMVFNVKSANEFIGFCTEAFGARERMRRLGPGDSIVHAELDLGATTIWVSDAIKDPPTSIAIAYFVEDCDAVFASAIRAGATESFPPAVPPWGGRWARVTDRWANQWTLVTDA